MTHICVGILTSTGSGNGLSPGRRQAIIWTNAGILLIEPLGTNFREILIRIQAFSFKKMHLKMSSAKGRLFSLGLNELMACCIRPCERHMASTQPWCVTMTMAYNNTNGITAPESCHITIGHVSTESYIYENRFGSSHKTNILQNKIPGPTYLLDWKHANFERICKGFIRFSL